MANFTTSCTFTEITPNAGMKEILIKTPTAADSDYVTVTLADHGISETGLLTVNGYTQTTTASVVVVEDPITRVIDGVLSISSGVGTGIKLFRILGRSK